MNRAMLEDKSRISNISVNSDIRDFQTQHTSQTISYINNNNKDLQLSRNKSSIDINSLGSYLEQKNAVSSMINSEIDKLKKTTDHTRSMSADALSKVAFNNNINTNVNQFNTLNNLGENQLVQSDEI